MKRAALAASALAALALAAGANARIVTLPSPVAPLSASPPLGGGAAASAEAVRHRIEAKTTVRVGIDRQGRPFRVVATQRLVVHVPGDYFFTIGAPVVAVRPAPGSASVPGYRSGALVWAGFDPGTRVLAARAALDPGASAEFLPLRIARSGGHTVLVNATRISAGAYAADAERTPLVQYLARLRAAARSGTVPIGGAVTVRSAPVAVQLSIAVPLHVAGTIGGRHVSLLLRDRAVVAATGRVDLRVDPVLSIPAPGAGSGRALLALATRAGLTFARARQYEAFLANPDPTGRTSTTYVFRTAAPPAPVAAAHTPNGRSWQTDLLVAAGLLAALAAAAVVWARS
jgi:hypothetical protein